MFPSSCMVDVIGYDRAFHPSKKVSINELSVLKGKSRPYLPTLFNIACYRRMAVCNSVHLMSDRHRSCLKIGRQFAAHSHVNHSKREYSRAQVHCNAAKSFSSLFERARMGVFHYLSPKHLSRYLNEFAFRWEQRVPVEKVTKSGVKKVKMKPIPIVDMLLLLIMRCYGAHLRRTKQWGIKDIVFT